MTYSEAAAELLCAEEFLRRNIRSLPHHKIGRTVSFDEDDIALIKARFAHRPDPSTSDEPLTRRRSWL